VNLALKPIIDYGLSGAVVLLNRGFADYVIHIEFDQARLLQMMVHDGVDVASSKVILSDEQAVGVALIARRGWTSRLAAMALVPEARRQGVGRWAMAQLIDEARSRGERRMVLEVIESNEPAVRLYQHCGFRPLRRLVGYKALSPDGGDPVPVDEVDVREVARLVVAYGLPDLPWQVSGESLALMGPPNRAYRFEDAYAVLSDPVAPQIVVRSVIVKPEGRGQGKVARLLRLLMSNHPDKRWIVPPLCPEEIGGLFERVGFERGELSQLQMVAEIEAWDGFA
jgi:GNAT superfamily N-acetyltransferase/predicted GNAT family acetyltransferase